MTKQEMFDAAVRGMKTGRDRSYQDYVFGENALTAFYKTMPAGQEYESPFSDEERVFISELQAAHDSSDPKQALREIALKHSLRPDALELR